MSRFCSLSALPPALSLQRHRCCCSRDYTGCNEHKQKNSRASVRPKRGCDPGMCCRAWLRGLAYLIFFTVLARSPRRASSKFVALAAIVIYGLNFLISFLFSINFVGCRCLLQALVSTYVILCCAKSNMPRGLKKEWALFQKSSQTFNSVKLERPKIR